MHNFITCTCGSGKQRFAKYDGYGIFLTYVCDKCEEEKMKQYRSDITEQYDTDEPIDADDSDNAQLSIQLSDIDIDDESVYDGNDYNTYGDEQ